MKIAVTSTGKDLSSNVDSRFGRAANFIIVNPENMDYEVVENAQNLDLPQGAGIQAGKTIVDSGATVLITGFCGPKAFKVLQKGGVRIVTSASGQVMDAVTQFKNGEFEYTTEANAEGHWV